MGCANSSSSPPTHQDNVLISKTSVSFKVESWKTKYDKVKVELIKLSNGGYASKEDILHVISSDKNGMDLPECREAFRKSQLTPKSFLALTDAELETMGITDPSKRKKILAFLARVNSEASIKCKELAQSKALRSLNLAVDGFLEPLREYIHPDYIRDLLEASAQDYKNSYFEQTKKRPTLDEVNAQKVKIVKAFIQNFEDEKHNADPYSLAERIFGEVRNNKYQFKYYILLGVSEEGLRSLFDTTAKIAVKTAKSYIIKFLNSFVDYLKRPVNYEELKKQSVEIEDELKRDLEDSCRKKVFELIPSLVHFKSDALLEPDEESPKAEED